MSACASVEVTPRNLSEAVAPEAERVQAMANWTAAVGLANEFLASPFRQSLPAGHFDLNEDGMVFHTTENDWPITVRCTAWGDLCLLTGFSAQERSWGFVVGEQAPGRDRFVDNSFLRAADGALAGPYDIAALLLHETTHVVLHEGTVSFWQGLAYYLEAVFMFRYEDHSAERKPQATSSEFADYYRQQAAGSTLAPAVAEGNRLSREAPPWHQP